jgi:hypothetical protein
MRRLFRGAPAPATRVPSRPPIRSPRPRRPAFHLGLAAAACFLVAAVVTSGPEPGERHAGAVVVHELGFDATVLGWTSWYGAYGLGWLGWGWCIDHGAHAPDGDFGYVPTSIDGETTAELQAAMSWAATVNEPSDPVTAAATMLVLHDFRHAVYPFGVLDVDRLTEANLGGFGGREGEVLAKARSIKADALAHAHYRAPFSLRVEATPKRPGEHGTLTAVLADADGTPVPGMVVSVAATGAQLAGPASQPSDEAGATSFDFVAAPGPNDFVGWSVVPDPRPRVFGSSTVRAQRIIQQARLDVSGAASFVGELPPTTTTTPAVPPPSSTTTTTRRHTTTSASTSTTRVPTTSTTSTTSTTTTTRPPTSTTSTSTTSSTTTSSTTTSSTTTSTTVTPPSTTIASPPPPSTRPPVGRLPVTGSSSASLVLVAGGCVLSGAALRLVAADLRRRRAGAGP